MLLLPDNTESKLLAKWQGPHEEVWRIGPFDDHVLCPDKREREKESSCQLIESLVGTGVVSIHPDGRSSGPRDGRPQGRLCSQKMLGRERLLFVEENVIVAHHVKRAPRHKAEKRSCGLPRHTSRQKQKESKPKVRSKRKPQRETYAYLKEREQRRRFKVALSPSLSTEGCASIKVSVLRCNGWSTFNTTWLGGVPLLKGQSAGISHHHQKL